MRLILILIIFLLQGCADVAVSGAQAVYNRHSIKKNISDQYSTLQAYRVLRKDEQLIANSNIDITTYNGEMLLAGQTPHPWQRQKIEQLVHEVSDVSEIHNLITISNPSSSLTRMSDTWITAKVKSKLIASEELDASQIKVVTENGTVFLMGIVKPDEANVAAELASNTAGVNKVVKIFKYMRITRS